MERLKNSKMLQITLLNNSGHMTSSVLTECVEFKEKSLSAAYTVEMNGVICENQFTINLDDLEWNEEYEHFASKNYIVGVLL